MYAIRSYYAEARRLEITEPDPSQDIEGIDTAAKLIIMLNAVTPSRFTLDDVRLQTIRDIDPQVAIRSGRSRITSYNVCYTKLLRL